MIDRIPRIRIPTAHAVTLYQDGRIVDEFSMPATDPRFVKDDGIFDLTYQEAKKRENWDTFSVFACGLLIFGNKEGERLRRHLTTFR